MPGVSETLVHHCPLVDRSSHKDIYISFLYIFDRPLEGCHRRLGGFRSRLTRLNEHIVGKTVDDVDSFLVDILGRGHDIGVDLLLKIVYLLAVKSENLG